MRRDWDLIRKMILAIEDAPSGWAPDLSELSFEGYTTAQVGYHAWLLIDAGLADGKRVDIMPSEAPEGAIITLTWAGHDFAEAIRNDKTWNKAMGTVKEKVGDITFDILKQLLSSIIKSALGLPMG
jgi:hypothetical protein